MHSTKQRAVDDKLEEPLLAQDQHEKSKPSRVASFFGASPVLFSGLLYCAASGSMVLLNKHALASFQFRAPVSLLCFQCIVAAFLAKAAALMGFITLQPLSANLVSTWFPANLMFVGMTGSSMIALRTVGVGMITLMKNLSNVVTGVCDVLIYKKVYNGMVWACLMLMLVSAGTGAASDVKFSWSGYSWQFINCAFTSAYALILRSTMDKVKPYTTTGDKMDEMSMVYFNNLLSIPPILLLMFFMGEFEVLQDSPALQDPMFVFVAVMSALIGFVISFFGLWYLHLTSATIYSLTGALNKIPVAILGIVAFHETSSPQNLASIGVGLLAGVLFVRAKQK